jgi:diguanylate cyclase (GGDEF)-like protein
MVLSHVAQLIRERVRQHDLVARFGGEELVVLMPETDLHGARVLADGLRGAIERHVVEYGGKQLQVTVSIGCAQLGPEDPDHEAFVNRCDKQLYRAKAAGRNCVCG